MWSKKLVLACLVLAMSILLLFLSSPSTIDHARAEGAARAPQSPNVLFLPFIANDSPQTPNPLWRFGVDQVRRPLSTYSSLDLLPMRFGWYIDFGVNPPSTSLGGMEYMPTIRVKQKKKITADGTETYCYVSRAAGDFQYLDTYRVTPDLATISSIAAAHPGMTWIVGNEMDRVDWGLGGACSSQDEMLPEKYAQVYHDVLAAIRAGDSTAQVAMGALVQPSDLRIQYLQQVWLKYDQLYGGGQTNTMPVDVWNVHVYVYNEKSCVAYPDDCWGADIPAGLTATVGRIFKIRDHKNFSLAYQMLLNWRSWMKNHGQQQKPLITSEYGVVLPEWVQDPEQPGVVQFSPAQIRDSFMYPSFNYFMNQTSSDLGFTADGNRLMQRWAWWSMDYDDGECDMGVFYPENNGNLFNSGLGPSLQPTNCSFAPRGLAALGTYWRQYVQPIPAGSAKPFTYAPSRQSIVSVTTSNQSAGQTTVAEVDTANCSDSASARARMLEMLPSRDTAEGQRAWLTTLSRLTPGTRICLP